MNRFVVCLVIVCVSTFQSVKGSELLFGEVTNLGSINTGGNDHTHLSADGLSLYVTSGAGLGPPFSGGGRKSLSVFRRASVSEPWGPRERLSESVNGGGSTGVPSVTANELSLFYSDTIVHWGPILRDGVGGGDLWFSTRPSVDSDWGEATNVGEVINTRYLESDASVTADGLSLFFTSNRPGGSGNHDIWTSSRASLLSPWEEPQNLGPVVNSSGAERTPSISPDGLTLFFAQTPTQRPDLWATSRTDVNSPWQEPVHLGGKINSSFAEIAPQLSADGSTFYFSQWAGNDEFDSFAVDLLPFEAVPLNKGLASYSQDFDAAFGSDGNAKGIVLPIGWTISDNGTVFSNTTDRAFPVSSSLGSSGNPILNAGAEGDGDRTLAIGAKDGVEGGMIQLLADVAGDDATSVQLQFDVEAWDARNNSRTDNPGEAAFRVQVDIDRGDGYQTLADLGTVTTGLLETPTGDYLNGNAAENRVSFDSGRIDGSIPAGSKLRVRWHVDRNAQSNNWVFGLDNVNLALFDTLIGSAGDFNLDGLLDIDDLNTLVAAIQAGSGDIQFDVDQSGVVDLRDQQHWVTELKQTWMGDANLDGVFDSGDLITVFQAGEYEDSVATNSTWVTGDWNGDAEFDSGDLVSAFQDGGYELGPRAAVSAVPEPTSVVPFVACLIGIAVRRRRSS